MRHRLIAGVVTIVGLLGTAVPALAQAKGSAEASAAAVVNPKWTPPKLAWGHPDLEGIWTSDDMRGVPMSRPAQFGTRRYLTDEEFAQRAKERSDAREFDNARTGTFRNEEGSRDFGYTSLVDRSRGRPRPGADARSPGAPPRPRYQRRWSLQYRRGLQQLRPLHHARPGGLVAAGGLRQRHAHHADARRGHHRLRDGARHARHPARRPAAHRQRHPPVDGRFARPLGGQHARHRDDQLHRSDRRRCQRRRRPGTARR